MRARTFLAAAAFVSATAAALTAPTAAQAVTADSVDGISVAQVWNLDQFTGPCDDAAGGVYVIAGLDGDGPEPLPGAVVSWQARMSVRAGGEVIATGSAEAGDNGSGGGVVYLQPSCRLVKAMIRGGLGLGARHRVTLRLDHLAWQRSGRSHAIATDVSTSLSTSRMTRPVFDKTTRSRGRVVVVGHLQHWSARPSGLRWTTWTKAGVPVRVRYGNACRAARTQALANGRGRFAFGMSAALLDNPDNPGAFAARIPPLPGTAPYRMAFRLLSRHIAEDVHGFECDNEPDPFSH